MDTAGGGPATPEGVRGARARPAATITGIVLVGVLLIAALGAGAASLYREFYSPRAFVQHYLELLQERRTAEALAVPGVAVDSAELQSAGLPATASEALLRPDALTSLTDAEITGESADGDETQVTVSYTAGGYAGKRPSRCSTTRTRACPPVAFARSPLSVMKLTVEGSMRFAVNGFEVDKRQVSVDGADVDPTAAVPLLVFSPGLYSVDVDTAISATPGVAVLADAPLAGIPVDVQAQPTDEFISVVQSRVEDFLTTCAQQKVLQPTGCPFGFTVRNRIDDAPTWSIVQQPEVTVVPDGAGGASPRRRPSRTSSSTSARSSTAASARLKKTSRSASTARSRCCRTAPPRSSSADRPTEFRATRLVAAGRDPGVALGEASELLVVRVELEIADAVDVTVASALLTLVAPAPLDGHRDRQDERGDLADRPRHTAADVLILKRCRPPGPAHRAEPLRDHQTEFIMMAMPKKACIAMIAMSTSRRMG